MVVNMEKYNSVMRKNIKNTTFDTLKSLTLVAYFKALQELKGYKSHGASPNPFDDGIPPVIALFDKLIEYQDRRYPYQLDSCLRLLLRTLPFIELPFKPLIYEARKEMFIEKYEVLLEDKLIQPNRVFGVPELKHLSRCKIREELNKNCQLPRGIKQLKIPGKLRRYIDLMEE
uniref:CSON006101 protein n=1 Tax=Culicoides sonorensis TaxID=179676 RepID=A0A336LAI7_CULSO